MFIPEIFRGMRYLNKKPLLSDNKYGKSIKIFYSQKFQLSPKEFESKQQLDFHISSAHDKTVEGYEVKISISSSFKQNDFSV